MTRKTAQTQFLQDTGNLIQTTFGHGGFCLPRAQDGGQAIRLIEIMLSPSQIRSVSWPHQQLIGATS